MKTLITAKKIFTGKQPNPWLKNGYLIVENGKILELGSGDAPKSHTYYHTYDYPFSTITPSFVDTHCFFWGYALGQFGIDMNECNSLHEILVQFEKSPSQYQNYYIGKNINFIPTSDEIDEIFPQQIPVILFHTKFDKFSLNKTASRILKLNSGDYIPEKMTSIIKLMLSNERFISKTLNQYVELMNRKGVTTVKEMIFDDGYGYLEWLKKNLPTTLQIHFMSQPVTEPINIDFGHYAKEKLSSPQLIFSGFNLMTDGSISQWQGHLKDAYADCPITGSEEIDYDVIRNAVFEADKNGFRFSLHAQGDGAVSECINIFSECRRDINEQLVNRHAITDLELMTDSDAVRMGWLGITAEIYPQIQSLYAGDEKVKLTKSRVGESRISLYWNRQKLKENQVTLSCATDLPLLYPDIPASLYHACGGFFSTSKIPFNVQNTLSRESILTAWTYGGCYNLGLESRQGKLQLDYIANLAVINGDLEEASLEEIRSLSVIACFKEGTLLF